MAQENEMGQTLVAVVSGSSTADVVTESGASVQLDAAIMQQLGRPSEGALSCKVFDKELPGGEPLVISFTSTWDFFLGMRMWMVVKCHQCDQCLLMALQLCPWDSDGQQ